MCGRFVASRPVEDIADWLDVDDIEVPEELVSPRWNVAPTDAVLAVAVRPPRTGGAGGAGAEAGGGPGDSDGAPATPRRRLTDYRWGLVPSWAKDASGGAKAINARAETLLDRPSFRNALARRRCLIPADAFYEWEKVAGRRQPWCFVAESGEPLVFAGLWEAWRSADGTPGEGPGWHEGWLLSCTIITTEANDLVRPLHDRMPVVLAREHWDAWLEPGEIDPGAISSLLGPAPAGLLRRFPVSPEVNSNKSDGPQLVEPLAAAGTEELRLF